jgi:hypothetical protein
VNWNHIPNTVPVPVPESPNEYGSDSGSATLVLTQLHSLSLITVYYTQTLSQKAKKGQMVHCSAAVRAKSQLHTYHFCLQHWAALAGRNNHRWQSFSKAEWNS